MSAAGTPPPAPQAEATTHLEHHAPPPPGPGPQMYPPHMPPAAPGVSVTPTASLYVGELDPSVSEAMLFEIFNMIGPVAR